jgi:hypothetical protein
MAFYSSVVLLTAKKKNLIRIAILFYSLRFRDIQSLWKHLKFYTVTLILFVVSLFKGQITSDRMRAI